MNMLKTKIIVYIFLLFLFGNLTFAKKYVILEEARTYKFSETITATSYENPLGPKAKQRLDYLFIHQNNRIVRILYAVEDSSTRRPLNTLKFNKIFPDTSTNYKSYKSNYYDRERMIQYNQTHNPKGNDKILTEKSITSYENYYNADYRWFAKQNIAVLNRFPMIVKLNGKYLKIKPYDIVFYRRYKESDYYPLTFQVSLLDSSIVNDSFSKNNKTRHVQTIYHLLEERTLWAFRSKNIFFKDSTYISSADENNYGQKLDGISPLTKLDNPSSYINNDYYYFLNQEEGQSENKYLSSDSCLSINQDWKCDYFQQNNKCSFKLISFSDFIRREIDYDYFRYVNTIENVPIYKQLIGTVAHAVKFPYAGLWIMIIPDFGYFVSNVTAYQNGCYFNPDLEDRTFLINDMPIAAFLRTQTPNK